MPRASSGRALRGPAEALLIAILYPCFLTAHKPTSKPEDWREDLRALSTYLPQLHMNLFFQMASSDFYDAVADLIKGLNQRAASSLIDPSSDIWAMSGSQTISSGMLAAFNFRDLSARLIGEPTGGKPNSYGDIKTFNLPKSGIPVTYSTKYFRRSPVDTPSLLPDIQIAQSASDYFHARDPLLNAILGEEPASTSLAGFALHNNGGLSHSTPGANPSVSVGYGILDADPQHPSPTGLAIFSSRKGGSPLAIQPCPRPCPARPARYAQNRMG